MSRPAAIDWTDRALASVVADVDHSPAADAVLYVASAVVDTDPTRSLAMSLLRAVKASPKQVPLIEADLAGGTSPLWPHTEPDWYREGMKHFDQERVRLPVLFELP